MATDTENGTNEIDDASGIDYAAETEIPAQPEIAAETGAAVSKPATPVKTPKAVKAAKAVKARTAVKTAKSVKAAKSVTAPKAVKTTESVKTAKPVKAVKRKTTVAPKKVSKPEAVKTPEAAKPVVKAAAKGKKKAKLTKKSGNSGKDGGEKTARILDSKVVYEGPLFRVLNDHLIEPGGRESRRDVIRHNGSVVILAVDQGKKDKRKNPWIVVERQYRHAAGQYLWELPAGKLDAGEEALAGAKRELSEETGYQARKWTPLMEYYASPGFLGESMKIFLAEGLVAGDAHPEEDEQIDFRLVRLSELLELVDTGKIIDGKTLTGVLLYARQLGLKRKK